jgi:hypothetical protein
MQKNELNLVIWGVTVQKLENPAHASVSRGHAAVMKKKTS